MGFAGVVVSSDEVVLPSGATLFVSGAFPTTRDAGRVVSGAATSSVGAIAFESNSANLSRTGGGTGAVDCDAGVWYSAGLFGMGGGRALDGTGSSTGDVLCGLDASVDSETMPVRSVVEGSAVVAGGELMSAFVAADMLAIGGGREKSGTYV